MDQHSSAHGVQKMCRVIRASRSGYYRWKKQPQSKRQKENEKILTGIRESHKNSGRAYGSPRITDDLREAGTMCGENRIARLMKANRIVGKAKKKFKATTNSRHNLPVAENLLEQNFVAERPDTKWVGDITYVWTMEGWLYLAVILDLYSRQVVGWAMSDRLKSDFVVEALRQAIGRRNPDPCCIFHSDRGIQYASDDFRTVLKANGFIQSMSRKGAIAGNIETVKPVSFESDKLKFTIKYSLKNAGNAPAFKQMTQSQVNIGSVKQMFDYAQRHSPCDVSFINQATTIAGRGICQ